VTTAAAHNHRADCGYFGAVFTAWTLIASPQDQRQNPGLNHQRVQAQGSGGVSSGVPVAEQERYIAQLRALADGGGSRGFGRLDVEVLLEALDEARAAAGQRDGKVEAAIEEIKDSARAVSEIWREKFDAEYHAHAAAEAALGRMRSVAEFALSAATDAGTETHPGEGM
jgi:hypothetical protein